MKTTEHQVSEISKWQRWKWVLQDMAGLYIHKFIAWASNDPEVKELYREMEQALIEEGDQPESIRISKEIRSKIMLNTQERVQ